MSELPESERTWGVCLPGIAGSPGVAIGPAVVLGVTAARFKKRQILEHDVEAEVLRLRESVHNAKTALRHVIARASHIGQELTILDAYVLMLGDPILLDEAERHIRIDRQCAEWAVSRSIEDLTSHIASSDDPYLRERGHDFQFVGDMLIRTLRGERGDRSIVKLDRPSIVVARDLSPADTAAMVREPVIAIVTEVGTRTSHTSIMARALEIPAVVVGHGCAGADQLGRRADRRRAERRRGGMADAGAARACEGQGAAAPIAVQDAAHGQGSSGGDGLRGADWAAGEH